MLRSAMFSVLTAAVLGATAVFAIDPPRKPQSPTGNGELLLTYNNTMLSPKFRASSLSVQWIATGEDGQYITETDAGLVFANIATGVSQTFVASDKFPPNMWEYWVRPDLKKVLFSTDYVKQYRYSYFANYFVLDVASGELTPLVADQAADVQYAEFSPVGDAIAFVRGNNLFLSKGSPATVTQITTDGSPDLFHGVPDWVYEEEIYGDRKTLWFSPDGEYLAYLSFDETGVQTYRIPYYMAGQPVPPPYPEELELRYPKVGTKNPTVALSLLAVNSTTKTSVSVDAFPPDDLIIGEVAWVTSKHNSLLYRAYNRVQDHEKLVVVDVTAGTSKTVQERDGSDGWLEPLHAIQYVGTLRGSCNTSYYVDLSDASGWTHLYLNPVQGGKPVALTSGEWEVTEVTKIDRARQLIYFQSTERHSTERHLYSVSYATGEKKALVDDKVAGYWSASFSANASYYILSYQGPDVPYQELYAANDTTAPLRVVTSNRALWDLIQQYSLPNTTWFEMEHPSGFRLNVMQRLPPNFDPTKKYPALFIPYGGPASQEVTKRYLSYSWKAWITSDPELEYITYTVDNRGTGLQGRAFRNTVASKLGTLEAEDQVWAAEQLAAKFPFVDASKIAIFGWSYGGFLSAKVLELDSGAFSTALIVAPVSDWRLYDSMYTERYMKTYQMNEAGYNATAVRNPQGFKNAAGGFTIMHGTGDDNVHYQNTAALVDLLVGAGLGPQQMRWLSFTDSDHSIAYNNANAFVYKTLSEALYKEKIRVPGQDAVHQWTRRKRALEDDRRAVFHFG